MTSEVRNPQHDAEFRLECLKLAHRPDRAPQDVIAVAREYLAWAGGVPTTPQGPGDGSKVVKLAPADSARTSLPKKPV